MKKHKLKEKILVLKMRLEELGAKNEKLEIENKSLNEKLFGAQALISKIKESEVKPIETNA